MLLQRLVEYSERADVRDSIVPAMYKATPVAYWIEVDGEGRLEGFIPVEEEPGGRRKAVPVPTLVRSVAIKPKLLADNAEYVLGLGREGAKADRLDQQRSAFLELTRHCAEATREPDVRAVLRFLEGVEPASLPLPDGFDPGATIGFRVGGRNPADLTSVQAFWAQAASAGEVMQCLVCGQRRPAMERVQLRLQGIPGGQTSGVAMISANADAFESYGLAASYTSPTCLSCSDRFMQAAQLLVRGETTHLRLGAVVYIFWTRTPSSFSAASLLSSPDPDQVSQLLRSVFSGRRSDLDPTPFYAAALSASGARAVIRDWIDTTVGEVQHHLTRFFSLQRLVDMWDDAPRPMGIYALAGATVRRGDEPSPWVATRLLRCALQGGPLPRTLLFKAVERCRLEAGVSRPRAALIKMTILSQRTERELEGGDPLVEMDINNRDPAYLCGRLFAELEAVQRQALGEVGAGIVARYYGTASSAPATVFGRLVRGAQPHLMKLRRDRPGAYHALDERLQEIQGGLERYPAMLTLLEQGMFALGYYHQRAADRHAARQRRGDGAGANEVMEEVTE